MTKDEYLSIRQAARLLSISEPVLRLTIRCGKIPGHRRPGGRATVVRKTDLLPFLDPRQERPAGQIAS
jgi:excisionase family DNA binding protein